MYETYRQYKATLTYSLKCRKNTESKNRMSSETNNGKIMLLSTCAVCDSKKSRVIKDQKAN